MGGGGGNLRGLGLCLCYACAYFDVAVVLWLVPSIFSELGVELRTWLAFDG